ncbi:hypothetical protein FLP10_14545 [Agromyces intestinalis]|uniref:Uncharacterized protein n=1 Tax=Agromyces intestinalis TaxID=2592652 RepID=A0A5C1YL31_9MICO|nr:hypothetical protein [Agromyces intestinalis]QEO15512.1 hypothetical protein FLP10_14545 [Agromyces intestinalis]
MSHHDDDLDPLERLRAADPAAGVEPRDGFVDDVVASVDAAASDAAPVPLDASDPTSPAVADLATERARRRPRWIALVGAAASLAVVGAVGYGVGAATGGQPAPVAAPPITLGEGGVTEEAPMAGTPGIDSAVGGAKMSARDAMAYPGWSGRNEFHASGLSTESGTAAGYGYDARSRSNAETVNALAAALGLAGTAEVSAGAWVVGPNDGTGPTLTVGLDGTLSFSYYNPSVDPWVCDTPDAPCTPTGEPPAEQAAIDALRSLIAAAGDDPDAYEYEAPTYEGAVTRTAQAWPLLDGQRLDQAWWLELTADGVYSASGSLAELVPLGDYPIVSEQAAFERLSDPRFGAQLGVMPLAAEARADVAVGDQVSPDVPVTWEPPTEPPAVPAAGAIVSWPVHDVEIVEARLGFATQWQHDGSVLVVPAYAFTDAGGGIWSVIAVADESLDFASR